MSYQVTYTPSEKNIEQLKEWLFLGKFYDPYKYELSKGLENGKLTVITSREEAIGYLLYEEESPSEIYIRVTEISPDFQRKGAGRLLVNSCISKFEQEGKSLIYLKDVYDSESFWKKMGSMIVLNTKQKITIRALESIYDKLLVIIYWYHNNFLYVPKSTLYNYTNAIIGFK